MWGTAPRRPPSRGCRAPGSPPLRSDRSRVRPRSATRRAQIVLLWPRGGAHRRSPRSTDPDTVREVIRNFNRGQGRVPRVLPLCPLALPGRGPPPPRARLPAQGRSAPRLGSEEQRRGRLHAPLRLLAQPHRGAVQGAALLHRLRHRPPRPRHQARLIRRYIAWRNRTPTIADCAGSWTRQRLRDAPLAVASALA